MPHDATLLILDGPLVESLLQPDDVLAAVREAFVLHSDREGRVFPVIRERLPLGGVFGIKAGDVPQQRLLGFKAAGFWPQNRAVGGEPHQATVMLFDPASGRPVCMMDGNAITTARTGAAGALGLSLLARPDSAALCLFGSGVQARIQLRLALRQNPRIERVRYLTSDARPDARFEAAFGDVAHLTHATDADSAVRESDVVITATPGAGALFAAEAVRPGTHLNCVGSDTKGKQELPAGLISRTRLFADDRDQSRQIGEGQWHPDHPAVEVGDLLTGRTHFERSATDVTMFDMTGLALQDLTVGRFLHQRAAAAGLGTVVPWPW